MLDQWLRWQQRNPCEFTQFAVVDIEEKAAPTEAVINWLQQILVDAKVGNEFLESARQALGPRLKALLEAALPQTLSLRRGDFGEALADAVCQHWHGYLIPVKKLRFALGGSPRGTDNLEIRLNGNREIES